MRAHIRDSEPVRRFSAMEPSERLRAAMIDDERLHPGYASEIEYGISRAWSGVPFQRGAWPNERSTFERLRKPDGRIYSWAARSPIFRDVRKAPFRQPMPPRGPFIED